MDVVVAAPMLTEPVECSDGAILAESAVPGAYQQICMGLPARSITLKTTGDTIRVFQGTSSDSHESGGRKKENDASVAGRTGVALWNSGILLTRLLDAIATKESGFFNGKTVLELGCGTALASVAASKLGAEHVIATDGNEEVCNLARRNLYYNAIGTGSELGAGLEGGLDTGIRRGEANLLKWGLLDAADYYDAADVIIGSDLTYNSGSWGLLAETLDAVLKPNGIVLYLTLGHAGFNVSGELGGFLTVVESKGALDVVKEGDPARWPFPNISSLEMFLGKSLTSQERDVISATGGYKIVVLKKKKRSRR
eukprot:CAMPEP_0197244350 /NCGR_PEP_ID=MMETSP1429-20130617/9498_1 /TAXON_ID=49237 /ORGANISM="Chaetoceros  sp., Strain UNC1202" /LENGTH=310 /DNA_ID=CAMNT_0042704697 /DNA_START=157 /DNA_END=1089 /DNA_ORIENTATION=-